MPRLAAPLRTHLTYANVMSTIAVVATLSTGTAYAAARIGSPDVIDNSLRSVDVRNGTLTGADLGDNLVGSADVAGIKGGDVADGSLTGEDVADDSINSPDVFGLTGADVVDDSIGPDDVAALTGADIDNSTLSSADLGGDSVAAEEILDGSVGYQELSDSAKQQLHPKAYYVNGTKFVDTEGEAESEVVFSRELPAGSYVVLASGDFYNASALEYRGAGCTVTLAGSPMGMGASLGKNDGTGTNEEEFALTGFRQLTEPGTIALECFAGAGEVAVGGNLVAIRVSSVS